MKSFSFSLYLPRNARNYAPVSTPPPAKWNGPALLRLAAFFGVHLAVTLGAPYFFSSAGLVTLFWPATGIALAAVLLGGYAYAFATLLSCAIAGFLAPEKGIVQIFFTLANTLEIFIARYWLLNIARIDARFDKATDYLKFVLFAGVLLPLPAALIAAAAITKFTTPPAAFWFYAREWWMADSLGILSLTPLLLIWRRLPAGWFDAKYIAEGVIGTAVTVGTGYFLLASPAENMLGYAHGFLVFIPVAWAATRFGRHATLFITSIIVAMALAGTRTQGGLSPAGALSYLNIWLFLVTLSTVGMALATVFNERRVALRKNTELVEAYRREEARRRESDHALRKTSIDFQRLVETSEEGVWTIDTLGKTTFTNARMAQMLGYTPATMYGRDFTDFMKPARRDAAMALLSRRNSGVQETHEFAFEHKEGHEVWTLASTNPITDIEGNVIGALAMVTDVSGNRKTEQALRESEERFDKIVESIHAAVIIHQSGFVVYANPAAAHMMGVKTPAELIGINGIEFTHPDSRAEAVERIQKLMQTGSDVKLPPFRRKVVRIDGKIITVESTGFVIPYQGRQAMVVVGREVES